MDLRASLSETYSRAGVRCGGRWWASRMEMPASRGEEIISFNAIFFFFFCSKRQKYSKKFEWKECRFLD